MAVDVDYEWIMNNKKFFANLYRGKYVAVVNRSVVGIGRTLQEAYEDAKPRSNGKTPVLVKVDKEGDVQILMGMAGG